MTYNERCKAFCKKCKLYEGCCWSTSGRYANCIEGQNFMSGWELGQQDTIEEIEAVLNKGNESRCDDFFTIAEITRKIEQLKK